MGLELKCGGLAVAAGAAVRRPLQPRDTNVAASTVVVGKAAAPKPKPHPKGAGTRPAGPLPPPPAAPLLPGAQCCVSSVAVTGMAEVSLAEELEKARERRARLRAAREQTEREMEGRAEVMERAAAEWERRAEDQRMLVSELMRLVGMPDEVYTPVESLRSKEERKRRGDPTGSISTAASTLQADVGAEACSDQESELTGGIIETAYSDQESELTGGIIETAKTTN